jgi:hypothetical protein
MFTSKFFIPLLTEVFVYPWTSSCFKHAIFITYDKIWILNSLLYIKQMKNAFLYA